MRIRLLGEVGALTDRGEPVDVGPAKCQALLAALAVAAPAPVARARLIEAVWGEDPPRTAERTLQSYVTRLRKGLGAGAIVRVGAAYRLEVAPEAVDVHRFLRSIDAGDVEAALAEWAGPPLTGLIVPGLSATVDGWVERWLSAVEADLQARVTTDAPAVIGPLTELTATYPFREGLWALLMTALYRVGRQSDALAAYRSARQTLLEQLGVEPGPRLRDLESLVLGQDERLGGHVPPRPVRNRAGNLPVRLGRLIGRDNDLHRIEDALTVSPVVTVVGPGGIGKTRLALAVARRAVPGDGAWLIDLSEITASSDVPLAVAGPLGINERSGRLLSQSIVSALRSRQVLLVLDNCEHVIDGAAHLAQAIAEGCPNTRVLATSREGLGLGHGHERRILLAPLEPAGAGVELFNERASAVSPTFDARSSHHDVTQICRRLDGVPLAIELAAARTSSHTTADLLERLDDQLRVLVGGRRTSAERHRTLRATIQWSYDLLSPPEQQLFQRLSIFTGPFDRAAAETIAADPGLDVGGDALGGLVEQSMLLVDPGPFGQRFRLLETMRQFAGEHLALTGQRDVMAERHAHWCLERVRHLHGLLAGPGEIDGVARLDELWPNLRAAVDFACTTKDRRLAHALVRPVVAEVVFRSRHEIGDWVERILDLTPPEEEDLIVFGLSWAAQRYKLSQNPHGYEDLVTRYGEPDHPLIRHARAWAKEDYPGLARCAPEALADLRRRGEHDLAEQIEVDIGAADLFRGHFDEHDTRITKLADRYRTHGPPTLLNWTLMLLGYSASFQGRPALAEQRFDEAVSIAVPERTHSPNKAVEARTVFRRGDRMRAFHLLRSHIEELVDADNMYAACVASVEFINMMAKINRLPDAAHILCYLDTTGLLNSPGWETQVAETRNIIATTLPASGRDSSLTHSSPDHSGRIPAPGERILGNRQALEFMSRVLHEQTRDQENTRA